MTPDLRQERLSYAPRLSVITGNLRWCLAWDRTRLGSILAVLVGVVLWYYPPSAPLDDRGMHFIAILGAGVTLWVFEVFDEYVVALMMLLAWGVLGGIPTNVALAGFSKTSWLFAVGALGMAAAVTKSGLLHRTALKFLGCVSSNSRVYNLILIVTGFFLTPLLPQVNGRVSVLVPTAKAVSDNIGYKPRSSGSAGLTLSAYVGASQLTFVFLTGATTCLVGWSLLPESARSDFGWGMWTLAALPAGIFTLIVMYSAINVLFRDRDHGKLEETVPVTEDGLATLTGPLTRDQWISLSVLVLALTGWISKPLHGINEVWFALGSLVLFLMTGVLDKKGLKNNIDWGFLLFYGVIYSMAGIVSHLKVDRWLIGVVNPVVEIVSFNQIVFLLAVVLFAYVVRFFMIKTPTVILLGLGLMSQAENLGIHPGVFVLTVLIGVESWFLCYQTPSYLLAYNGAKEEGFTHRQARKLMVVKFLASFISVAISVPYWNALGLIKPKTSRGQTLAEFSAPGRPTVLVSELATQSSKPISAKIFLPVQEASVTTFQRLLSSRGHNPGPIDAMLDSRTRTAIRKFQKESVIGVPPRELWIMARNSGDASPEVLVRGRLDDSHVEDCNIVQCLENNMERRVSLHGLSLTLTNGYTSKTAH